MNGVPADHVARECNRVALGDEQAGSARVDYSGVTSDSRAHKDARVADVNSPEKRGKEIVRKFANIHRDEIVFNSRPAGLCCQCD